MRAKNKGGVMLSWLIVVAAAAMMTGCSSVPRVESGRHGLLQPTVVTDVNVLPPLALPSLQGSSNTGFVWPLKEGKVTSLFGNRKRDFHEGIDIRAKRGAPIYSTRGGVVIYSARRINGYGNMIVLRHDDGWASVYAHNRKNLVKRGDRVEQGQLIAEVGATGKATGPHLHFEVRRGEVAQDPLLYLPQIRHPAVASQ